MDCQIYGVLFLLTLASALPEYPPAKPSNSILPDQFQLRPRRLLDSHYTELSELVDKALLLQTLEEAVAKQNITIFAPRNEALERELDPEFKRFLLVLGNLKSLQNLLLFHMIPARIESNHWPDNKPIHHTTLCREKIPLNGDKTVSTAKLIKSDDIGG